MAGKEGALRKGGRKNSLKSPMPSGQPLQEDGAISSSSVDEHFARALSTYKKKEHAGSTPASPLLLGPQSPRSAGRPAPYHRIRRTNSLPQMQLQQIELENAISQLAGSSVSTDNLMSTGMARSLSASDIFNPTSFKTLMSPNPQRTNLTGQDDMDLSDLRQLEALLGAGPKQPIYSQAVNDNLFPLSELEEEAATLGLPINVPNRNYGAHGAWHPGPAGLPNTLFSEAQQQLRAAMQPSFGNGANLSMQQRQSGILLGQSPTLQQQTQLSSIGGQPPLQLPLSVQFMNNAGGNVMNAQVNQPQAFGHLQQNLPAGAHSFNAPNRGLQQQGVQPAMGTSGSLNRQRTLSASGLSSQPVQSPTNSAMGFAGGAQMGMGINMNGMGGPGHELIAQLEGLDMRRDSQPGELKGLGSAKSLDMWGMGNQGNQAVAQRPIQTPPAGQLTSDAQENALGLGLEDVQLLLSAGIDV